MASEPLTVWAIPAGDCWHTNRQCAESSTTWVATVPGQDWLRTLRRCNRCSSDTYLAYRPVLVVER